MAVKASSLRDRKAHGAARLLSAVPTAEVMGDLVDTVHDRILIEHIRPNPHQPRQAVNEDSDEFADLVGSIRQQGLIQPISLWQVADSDYIIIAGERRWRAFRRLAQDKPADYARIPATVTRLLGDHPEARALMMALIENVVRQDLKDGERADALSRLRASTGWTYEQIADRMGLSVSRVQDLASLARHDVVRDALNDGRITQKQALAIAQGVPAEQAELASELVGVVRDLTPSQARAIVKEAKLGGTGESVAERVRRARETVVVGPAPSPEVQRQYDIRSQGRTLETVSQAVVVINATSLRVLRPRIQQMDRDDFATMLQCVCEETNVWPQRPA
ncbi:MAG: ParB/RepB/Spo0J family partition protein [Candidatus Dormibacteraeota bacterium]|nr:ParB/RepB/Spo0J family partition protein [Candidatus Dormibacteraeota bacterium]